jgi:hypothetical protein
VSQKHYRNKMTNVQAIGSRIKTNVKRHGLIAVQKLLYFFLVRALGDKAPRAQIVKYAHCRTPKLIHNTADDKISRI